MMLGLDPVLKLEQKSPDFLNLLGVDGQRYSLSSFQEKRVLVIIFISNGCPTVKASEERLISTQETYRNQGVQLIAINSNNSFISPADTYQEMVKRAEKRKYSFPYVKDDDRSVARSFGAICTPHVFVLDSDRRLRYRGRIDDSRDPTKVTTRDLNNVLEDLIAGKEVRTPETRPFGCSIVW